MRPGILISVINGNIDKGAVFPGDVQDTFWDFLTIFGTTAICSRMPSIQPRSRTRLSGGHPTPRSLISSRRSR